MKEIYHNKDIYVKTKTYFNTKKVFTDKDILDWIEEYKEEYENILENSVYWENSNVSIKRYNTMNSCEKSDFQNKDKNQSEESKFASFYKNITILKDCYNRNKEAKTKIAEYQKIRTNDKELQDWLIKNENTYYTIWENLRPFGFSDNGIELMYYIHEDNPEEYIKFFVDKTNFIDSIRLSKLLEWLYPAEWLLVLYAVYVENKETISFKADYLKIFSEKESFSFKELSIWLSDNKGIEELTSIQYSLAEKYESQITENIITALGIINDLYRLQLISKEICNWKDNGFVDSEEPKESIDEIQYSNYRFLLYSTLEKINKDENYVIYKNKWFEIVIASQELIPLKRIVEEFKMLVPDEDIDLFPF